VAGAAFVASGAAVNALSSDLPIVCAHHVSAIAFVLKRKKGRATNRYGSGRVQL
jgi:hypothetical protein